MENKKCYLCGNGLKIAITVTGFMWYCPQCNKNNKLACTLEHDLKAGNRNMKNDCVYSVYNRPKYESKKRNIRLYLSTNDLIGCKKSELINYIESMFVSGMSWNNWGTWHIDHKTPLSNFDLQDINGQINAFNYSNLQVLWADDHYNKNRQERKIVQKSSNTIS